MSVRWRVKKVARAALVLASLAVMPLRRMLGTRRHARVRVLTYHRLGSTPHDAFCISEEEFERQMAWIARNDLAISLGDLDDFIAGKRMIPPDSVLVTFDDGHPSLFSRTLPIARRHNIPILAFVPVGEVPPSADERGADLDSPDARITFAELVELTAHGVTIGSHAYTHRSLGRLPLDVVRSEVEQSRAALESATGKAVTAFAYPFGTRADYNGTTTAILRSSGYRFGFTSQHGAVTPDADRLILPRVKIEGGEGLWMFRAIVHGGLDAWRWIDRFFWRLQAVP